MRRLARHRIPSGFLLPDLDDETSAPFWAGTARGELLVQACGACGARRMPPRPMCPACQLDQRAVGADERPRRRSGRSSCRTRRCCPPTPSSLPYNAIVVALDEDPTIRFVGNLVATADGPINGVDPATITIGEPVRVVFQTVDDVTLPRWIRASD